MRHLSTAIAQATSPIVLCCIPFLLRCTSPHSHSIVSEHRSALISMDKIFLLTV